MSINSPESARYCVYFYKVARIRQTYSLKKTNIRQFFHVVFKTFLKSYFQ